MKASALAGLFFFGLLLGAPDAAGQGSSDSAPARVGEIRVRTLDVFSPEEAARGWLYRTANSVRVQTREAVIRKFLLFHEGDPFEASRLEETERNLRDLPFLKTASVIAGPVRDGVRDVDVVTQDAWTTEPGVSFGRRGGVTTYGFVLKEKDFLGSGRQIAVAYAKDTERTNRLVQYIDPYLLGPYWRGDLLYANNSDGEEERVSIERPFVSFVDRSAVVGLFDHLIQNERLFADGETLSRYRQKHTEGIVRYAWAASATNERARRFSVGFQSVEDQFALLPTSPAPVLPEDRRFRFVTVGYEDVGNEFVKLNYINRDVRYEDFNLARRIFVEIGVSPAAFGGERTTERLRVSLAQGWRLSDDSFLLASLDYQTRWARSPRNEIVSGSALFIRKFPDAHPLQTFVSRLMFDRGWNLDRDVQFFADGANGLRGYRLYAFEGDKRVVWNAEQRFFLGREFLQLFSPGAAVFFDTGAATPPGQPLRLADFKSDVGVGIRFSITRAASHSVLRFDVAYALNPDSRGRRGFLVSFSSGQVF
ncbi:MAG: hypothetical protein M3R34_01015 [Acidobacteriota bacterium]|nr:hypothetical protein [Acidobacteriota bacterium]